MEDIMKTKLSKEQSIRLIEFGVNPDKASSWEYCGVNDKGQYRSLWWDKPIVSKGETSIQDADLSIVQKVFTLSDLFALLPKELIIDGYVHHLNIDYPYLAGGIAARYLDEDGDSLSGVLCSELIDALYSLFVRIFENGYYGKENFK